MNEDDFLKMPLHRIIGNQSDSQFWLDGTLNDEIEEEVFISNHKKSRSKEKNNKN